MENIIVGISKISSAILFPVMMFQALTIETRECGDCFYVEAIILALAISIIVRAEYCRQEREENKKMKRRGW